MTRDDIIRMAREAGFVLYDMHDVDGQDLGESVEADDHGALERFATMAAARALQEAPTAAQEDPAWWRKRANEIELEVALGRMSAMACYTDMQQLLRAAAQPADTSVLEDAARYRWLCEQNANLDDMTFYVGCDSGPDDQDAVEWVGVDLDAAIDAARAKEGQKP